MPRALCAATVPNGKTWSMEDLGNGWVLGRFVTVGSRDNPWECWARKILAGSCLQSADLARLDLPECTPYEEESPFYS